MGGTRVKLGVIDREIVATGAAAAAAYSFFGKEKVNCSLESVREAPFKMLTPLFEYCSFGGGG